MYKFLISYLQTRYEYFMNGS